MFSLDTAVARNFTGHKVTNTYTATVQDGSRAVMFTEGCTCVGHQPRVASTRTITLGTDSHGIITLTAMVSSHWALTAMVSSHWALTVIASSPWTARRRCRISATKTDFVVT